MSDEGSDPDGDEDRQEYYTESIQRIIDQQKEELGEQTAIKWARRAPIKIDADGQVQGFYGTGEDALETLRDYTEHEDFYLDVIQSIVDRISGFMGDDVGMKFARKAPLQITPDGEVQAYYGTGRKALGILIGNYEDYMGGAVADQKIKGVVSNYDEEKYDLVPERVRPEKESEKENSSGLLGKILGSSARVLYVS